MGTISKALDLLNFFGAHRAEIGLSEFMRLSKRDKATVHRHLTELTENGFLEQDPESRAYRLGPALLRLSALRETLFPMRKILQPIVSELSEAAGELAHASLLQNAVMSPLIHADPQLHGVRVHFDMAEMLPLHATSSGLAALAFCPDSVQNEVLSARLERFTESTITDPSQLREVLAEVRRYGLSSSANGFEYSVSSVGAPVFGQAGQVIGALAVAVPAVRSDPQKTRVLASLVRDAAERASVALGFGARLSFQPLPPNWAGVPALQSKSEIMEPSQ